MTMPLVFLHAVIPDHGVSNWGSACTSFFAIQLRWWFFFFGLLVQEWCIITVIKTSESVHLERLHNVLIITLYGSGN